MTSNSTYSIEDLALILLLESKGFVRGAKVFIPKVTPSDCYKIEDTWVSRSCLKLNQPYAYIGRISLGYDELSLSAIQGDCDSTFKLSELLTNGDLKLYDDKVI